MIFELDCSIIGSDRQKVSKALCLVSEKKGLLLVGNNVQDWIDKEILNENNEFLSKFDVQTLKTNQSLWNVTKLQRNYHSTIKIGKASNMFSIDQMLNLLEEKSYLILENSNYDWPAIKHWIELYKNDREFKSLNQQVLRAIKEDIIREAHAGGGNGTIVNQFNALLTHYHKGCGTYKLTTIFDSDKTSSTDTGHNKALIQFLANNGFAGHELYKREIENYFPIEAYRQADLLCKNQTIPDYTPEEYDFIDIQKATFTNYQKNQLPRLVPYLTKEALSNRIGHHKHSTSVDEIQEIIILLAKFI